jgi:hypothetical protein
MSENTGLGQGRSNVMAIEASGKTPPPVDKLAWKTPVLVAYGSVRQLTQGATGILGDANGMFLLSARRKSR